MEAIGILGAAVFGRVDDETLLRRGVRPGVPKLYKTAFPSKVKVNRLFFSATTGSGACFEIALWNPLENPDPAWRFMTERLERAPGDVVLTRGVKTYGERNQEQGIAALETVKLETGDPALVLMDELRAYSIHCPNIPSLRGLVQDLQTREPVGLAGGRLPEAVDELLVAAKKNETLAGALDEVRDLLDWASDFSAGPSASVPLSPSAARSRLVIKFTDRFMARGRNSLTGYDASEGALYVLFCAVLVMHPRAPRCLAVDNVDQALNPRLARKLVGAMCAWSASLNSGRQWFFTAHNPAVLDGLPLIDDEIRLFAVDRSNEGHTVVRRIDLAAALKARPDDYWTLSRMWINGLLGGVPNV